MKRSSFTMHLSLVLLMHCLLVQTQAQEEDIDSNKVLSDFIWSKIISVSKSSPQSTSSKSTFLRHPNLKLVTIPYKPSSSSKSAISRRSSYSSSSLNPVASASSSSYSYESSGVPTSNNKFMTNTKSQSSSARSEPTYSQFSLPASEIQQSSTTTKTPTPKASQSSYSDSETGKNYFADSIQNPSQSASSNSKSVHETSKSLYDLVPMPTYGGFSSKYGGGEEQNNLYQKKRTLEIMPMIREGDKQSYGPQMEPQIIEVTPDDQPIQIVFRSTSTPVQVKQIHTPTAPREIEKVVSEEEPQRVQHQLTRPVIQEVFELIQPYRRIVQEVRPVLETLHTVISKASDSANGNHNRAQGQNGQPDQGMYPSYGRDSGYNSGPRGYRGNKMSSESGYQGAKGPSYG